MLCNHSETRKLDSPFKCCQIRAMASSPAKPQAGSFLPTRTRPEVPICRSSIQETEPRVSDNMNDIYLQRSIFEFTTSLHEKRN